MNKEIKQRIITGLHDIEREHSVEILLAVESGSRAWGFESTDSDYDVRFIYRHKRDWYLSVLPKRDVIEYPIVDIYDYSGWDLRKALFLMNKSNPVLFEWLISPIVYLKNEDACRLFADASARYFSPISSIYHYLHMAKGNNRDFLQGDTVKIKKYFYVLRPLFACMWIEKYNMQPPMEFEKLMNSACLSDDCVEEINGLLEIKRSGTEMGFDKRRPAVSSFIDEAIEHFEQHASGFNPKDKPPADFLNDIFISLLK